MALKSEHNANWAGADPPGARCRGNMAPASAAAMLPRWPLFGRERRCYRQWIGPGGLCALGTILAGAQLNMNRPLGASSQSVVPEDASSRPPKESEGVGNPPAAEPGALHSRSSRWAAGALLGVSTTVLACALVVGMYNVRYSYRRIAAIAAHSPATDDGSLDGSSQPTFPSPAAPDWVRPLLQDLSVVSPSLVVFTAACMSLSAFLILWLPAVAARSPSFHFPFPVNYKTYYVQFGLVGTIVGFVIAFSDIDLGAERQTMVLVEALGTALWSTLTALLLSYGICPVVELVYQRLRGPAAAASTDTRTALALLRKRTTDAADSLATLRKAANAATAELNLRQLDSRIQRLESTLAQVAGDLRILASTTTALGESEERSAAIGHANAVHLEATAARLSEVDSRLSELDRATRSAASTVDEMGTVVAQIKERDLGRHAVRIDDLDRRLREMINALRKALA